MFQRLNPSQAYFQIFRQFNLYHYANFINVVKIPPGKKQENIQHNLFLFTLIVVKEYHRAC